MPAFVRVIVDHSPDREFDYAVPEALADQVAIGTRVRLPFREKDTLGTIVGLLDTSEIEGIRPITALVGQQNAVRPKLIELARWMADYYACPVEAAMRSVLPQVIRKADVGFRQQIAIEMARPITEEELETLRRKAPRQAEAIDAIRLHGETPILLAELARKSSVGEATFRTLVEKGFLKTRIAVRPRDPNEGETFVHSGQLVLSPDQEIVLTAVVEALNTSGEKKPMLLHGVTGSGKTEIYLRAIQHTLDQGKSAIVLVPEISLTPQTTERFRERFNAAGHQVAVLHSHLSSGERHDEWHKIATGSARIVIGARSAVFAPVSDLGLIVVDEEHETSYKQEESPRYQARDVAIVRAKLENCAILLGSATPSLESYRNCLSGKYRLLELLQRVDDKKMPVIKVVDMREESRRHKGGNPLLSEKLKTAIEARLELREQTILFLNRRGYSTSLVCNACGFVVHCPNCSVPLTFHRIASRLHCHICGHVEMPPKFCPECRSPGIRHQGAGTEKIEEAVGRIFPKAVVRRMDADAMSKKDAFRETLNAFRTGKIDILVGTQMIAKGLHFPNVTLVGIINADSALHLPDFRAGERTFQLLTQVAGRAGRGDVEGEVFVQSHTPFHPCIQFARHHDFAGFQEQELDFREKCAYPPYTHMILVTVRSPHELRGSFSAETLARRLAENLPDGTILGQSAPAPMERLKGFYRFHIILRAHHILKTSRHIREVIGKLTFPEDVIVTTDVDPYQLL
ncbi:MAG TPA: primosomal protein N' [Chthoniobacterales bacterium]|jgi:primosomal protein N' (replication factor Y)